MISDASYKPLDPTLGSGSIKGRNQDPLPNDTEPGPLPHTRPGSRLGNPASRPRPRTPIPAEPQSLTTDPSPVLHLASWRARSCAARDSAASRVPRVQSFRTWKETHARGDVQRETQSRSPASWSPSSALDPGLLGLRLASSYRFRLARRYFCLCSDPYAVLPASPFTDVGAL